MRTLVPDRLDEIEGASIAEWETFDCDRQGRWPSLELGPDVDVGSVVAHRLGPAGRRDRIQVGVSISQGIWLAWLSKPRKLADDETLTASWNRKEALT